MLKISDQNISDDIWKKPVTLGLLHFYAGYLSNLRPFKCFTVALFLKFLKIKIPFSTYLFPKSFGFLLYPVSSLRWRAPISSVSRFTFHSGSWYCSLFSAFRRAAWSLSNFLIISHMVYYLLLIAFPDAFDDHADCQQHFLSCQDETPAEQSALNNSPSSHISSMSVLSRSSSGKNTRSVSPRWESSLTRYVWLMALEESKGKLYWTLFCGGGRSHRRQKLTEDPCWGSSEPAQRTGQQVGRNLSLPLPFSTGCNLRLQNTHVSGFMFS